MIWLFMLRLGREDSIMAKRDIGKMGESYFENLCNQVDITANRSEPDRYGWDFLLEFPKEEEMNISQDMQDLPIECKVQVKASDKNTGKCQIKLSAMERLVKNPFPSFIYFVNYNKGYKPIEAFLVHIDKAIMEQVLKRIRKNEVAEKKKNLCNIKITIKYDDSHKLNQIKGKNLKEEIEKYIIKGMKSYTDEKSSLLETIGFSEHSMSMTMVFKNKSGLIDLIDTSLGIYETKVPVLIEDTTMSRFNIDIPIKMPFVGLESVTVKVKAKPSQKAILTFQKNSLSSLLTFNMDMYIPYMPIEESMKIVFKNRFFVIEFNKKKMTFNYSIREKDKCSFEEFYKFLKFFEIVNKNPDTLTLSIKPEKLSIFKSLFTSAKISDDNKMLIYFSLIKRVKKIYGYFDLELDFELSLFDLESNEKYINDLYALIFEINEDGISLSLIAENELDYIPDKAAIVFPLILQFNIHVYYFFIIYEAHLESTSKYDFKFISKKIKTKEVFISSIEEDSKGYWERCKSNISNFLKDEHTTHIFSDNFIKDFKLIEET